MHWSKDIFLNTIPGVFTCLALSFAAILLQFYIKETQNFVTLAQLQNLQRTKHKTKYFWTHGLWLSCFRMLPLRPSHLSTKVFAVYRKFFSGSNAHSDVFLGTTLEVLHTVLCQQHIKWHMFAALWTVPIHPYLLALCKIVHLYTSESSLLYKVGNPGDLLLIPNKHFLWSYLLTLQQSSRV